MPTIHEEVAARAALAKTYAEDGAFYSAARCFAEAAGMCHHHADACNLQIGVMGGGLDENRFVPIVEALGLNQGELLGAMGRLTRKADAGLQGYAEQVETNDELEVDDYPLFSEADDGVWVSCWTWIAKPDSDEDDDEGEEGDE